MNTDNKNLDARESSYYNYISVKEDDDLFLPCIPPHPNITIDLKLAEMEENTNDDSANNQVSFKKSNCRSLFDWSYDVTHILLV